MLQSATFDVVIIGAGQGGVPFAHAAAQSGRRTALVERRHVGGTCINEGCTPTKTMIASARVAHVARGSSEYGVDTSGVTIDLERVRERKDGIVESWRESSRSRLEDAENLELIFGTARFTGPHELAVDTGDGELTLTADVIVIDTGTRPAMPPLPGLETVEALDSTSIMELGRVPAHLVVVGGGYVGVEFSQMFRRFGSRVTILQRESQLLPREDRDVADALQEIFADDGIDVFLDTSIHELAPAPHGGVAVRFTEGDTERRITASHLLVATGRAPNTEDLDLENAGIDRDDHGFIPVDERLATSVEGVYAIGDVNGGPQFTHVSYNHFRILRTNLLEGGQASTAGLTLPYTAFTDPQLGRVGLSEGEAVEQGRAVDVYKIPMSWVARAIEVGETRGLIKAVVDKETDLILGAAVLGTEGGEFMGLLQTAMLGDVTATTLREAMYAHPTLAEAVNNLFANPVEE